ncbi:MAG: SDR family oxidoreductase [Pirellulales bacterium]|nr:SDR family oxidoreductase [Pirellulales bacterium]
MNTTPLSKVPAGMATHSNIHSNTCYSVREYFNGKIVLLTGCTGLVGKVVLEKLLRSTPGIRNVTLVIRPRLRSEETLTAADRLRTEILANPLFDALRHEHGSAFGPWVEAKVTCIDGDINRDRFGLSSSAWSRLADRVDVVLHSAGTVNLLERIDVALNLNVGGPMTALSLAKAAQASMVHVSTAYVCGRQQGLIEEKILAPEDALNEIGSPGAEPSAHYDVEEEITSLKKQCRTFNNPDPIPVSVGHDYLSERMTDVVVQRITDLGITRARGLGWLDPYGYTKFLAEQMLSRHQGEVPLGIVRPSIVESTLCDPYPGWIQNYRMADPVLMNYGKGHIHDFPGCSDTALDLVPVDSVANAILAVAAYIGSRIEKSTVIHVATSGSNPLTMELLHDLLKKYFTANPMLNKSGAPIAVPDWVYPPPEVFTEQLRCRIEQFECELAGIRRQGRQMTPEERSRLRKLRIGIGRSKKLMSIAEMYAPYTTLRCRFGDTVARRVRSLMKPSELTTFDFSATRFAWEHYLCSVHLPGVRRHLHQFPDGEG